jgi:hypothetical protein
MSKFQVRVKPFTGFPTISESARIATSGMTKKSSSHVPAGKPSRYGIAARRSHAARALMTG